MKLGEFDPPEMNPYNKVNMSVVQRERHRKLAAKAASMSFVLLKNEQNILPIKKNLGTIAVSICCHGIVVLFKLKLKNIKI